MGRQLAGEVAVHVLGQGTGDVHVLLAGGDDVPGGLDGGGVAVHADSHAQRDGVGVLRQRHGRAGAHRVEVAGVLGGGVHLLGRDDPADLGFCIVACDGQAHRRGHHDALIVVLLRDVQFLVGGAVGLAGGLADARLRVAAVAGLHRLGFQRVLGGRLALDGLALVVRGLLVQALVDLVAGLVVVLVVGLHVFAAEQIVGLFLQVVVDRFAGLGQVAGDVRAHRGGQGLGHVLGVGVRGNGGIAGHLRAAQHRGLHAGIGDVQGHAGAHRHGFSDGEGARGGLGIGILLGGDVQIAVGGLDGGVFVDFGHDVVVQYVQRDGGVDADVLRVLGIQVAGNRVGTRGAGDVLLVVGAGLHVQLAHGVGALARGGGDVGVAVHHREGRADAHLHAVVGGSGGGGVAVIRLVALHDGDQYIAHVAVRHGEAVHELLLRLGDERERLFLSRAGAVALQLDLVGLAVLVRIGIGDAVQRAAGLAGHVDLHHLARAGLDGIVLLRFAALHGNADRAILQLNVGQAHVRHGNLVQHLDGLQLQCDHRVGGRLLQLTVAGGVQHPALAVVVLLQVDGARHLKAFLIGIGISGLVAVGHFVAVLQSDVDHRAVVPHIALQDRGRAAHVDGHLRGLLFILGHGLGLVAADILVVLVLGGFVVRGVALGIGCGGGHVLHAAQLVGLDHHFTGHHDIAVRRAIRDRRLRVGVEHRDGHASRDAHALRACAGDGLGIDHVSRGLRLLGLQRHAPRADQLADGGTGQIHQRLLRAVLQGVRNLPCKVGLGQVVDHLLIVEHLRAEGLGDMVRGVLIDVGDALRLPGVLDLLEGLDSAGAVLQRQAGHLHVLQRLLHGLFDDLLELVRDAFEQMRSQLLAEFLPGLPLLVALEHALEHIRDFLFHPAQRILLQDFQQVHQHIRGEQVVLQVVQKFVEQRRADGVKLLAVQAAQLQRVHDGLHHGLKQLLRQLRQRAVLADHRVHGVFEFRLQIAVAAKQLAQPRELQQLASHLIDDGVQYFAEQVHGHILIQANLPGQIGDVSADRFGELAGHLLLGFHFLGGSLFLLFFRFGPLGGGGDLQHGSLDLAVTHLCDVLEADDVHGGAHAHADVGIGDAGIGLDL